MNEESLRIWTLSDLHVDASAFALPDPIPSCDVVVVAGDVSEGLERSLAWMRDTLVPLGKPVVFVPGNHDYYGGDLDAEAEFRRRGAEMGIAVLVGGESLVHGGVRFIGATLWTDLAIADDILGASNWARLRMPDYTSIDVGMRRLQPRDLMATHARHLDALVDGLSTPHLGPTVVITHHAPHARSLRGGRASDVTDASWASDLTWVIKEFEPVLWIHGHVHEDKDYEIGITRVVCNPRGYVGPDQENENLFFDPEMVVEIPLD